MTKLERDQENDRAALAENARAINKAEEHAIGLEEQVLQT